MSTAEAIEKLTREVKSLSKKVDSLQAANTVWLTARDLARKTGKTREQLRSIRRAYPDLVKPIADDTTAYLYNWTALEQILKAA